MAPQDETPTHDVRGGGSHAAPTPAPHAPQMQPTAQHPVTPSPEAHQPQAHQQMEQYRRAPQQGGYPQQAVAPKNPILFALASFLLTGLGSLLAGATTSGLIFLGIAITGGVLAIIFSFIPFVGWVLLILLAPVLFVNWVWSMVHAYRSAQKWNQAHGIMS